MFNGGAAGRDYLVRYFSISAAVVLWIAIPFQLGISLPAVAPSLAAIDWYVAAIISITCRLDHLLHFAEQARMDFRDVIWWAEYEEPESRGASPRRVRDFNSPFE